MDGMIYTDGVRDVLALGPKTRGGAQWVFEMKPAEGKGKPMRLEFQAAPVDEIGIAAWTNEAVLAAVIRRLEQFQAGEFPCNQNDLALRNLRAAAAALEARTADRKKRRVEGKHEA